MAAPRIAPRVIDADSHVYEVDETWSALPSEFQSRRPLGITLDPKDDLSDVVKRKIVFDNPTRFYGLS